MSWQAHIDEINGKVKQRLGLLKRNTIKHLPSKIRKLYVNTVILPILEYGSIMWGDKNNQLLMNFLEVSINKAAKLILEPHPTSSASEALETLGYIAKRRVYHHSLYVYNSLHQL